MAWSDCSQVVGSLAGFKITILQTEQTTETDSKGHFVFPSVKLNDSGYYVKASKEGYSSVFTTARGYTSDIVYFQIARLSDLLAHFTSDWTLNTTTVAKSVDSVFVNSHGDSVIVHAERMVFDTLISAQAEVSLNGAPLPVEQVSLDAWMMTTPNGDGLFALAGSQEITRVSYSLFDLRKAGVKSGETVYSRLRARSRGSCSGPSVFGKDAEVKAFTMP